MGATHWHQGSWEVDVSSPATWSSSIARRPKLTSGQVSFIPTPGDDAKEWHANGSGGYVATSGRYTFAYVVWRCHGECPKS